MKITVKHKSTEIELEDFKKDEAIRYNVSGIKEILEKIFELLNPSTNQQ